MADDLNPGSDLGDVGELAGDLAIIESEETPEDKLEDMEETPEAPREEDEEEVEEEEEEQEDDEEEQEEEEDKEEEKDEEDEEEEDDEIRGDRPRFAQIRKEYPDIFKKFPDLRQIMIREERFSQVFPSVESAREAEEKSGFYDQFEASLVAGDPAPILKTLAENNVGSFKDVIDNFLPTVFALSRDAYFHVTQPVVVRALKATLDKGVATGDKNLILAARHVSKYLFGQDQVPEIRQQKGPDPESARLQHERESFFKERFAIVDADVNTQVQTELRQTVSRLISKEKSLTSYEKKALARDIIGELDRELASDDKHNRIMRDVWKRASQAGFTRNTTDRIAQTYLSRATGAIPKVAKRLISEALKDRRPAPTGKKTSQSERRPQHGQASRVPQSGPPRRTNRVPSAGEIDWGKTSDLDLISGRATLKRR